MKAKIKKGAFVGQDFGCHKWPHHASYDVNQIFDVFDDDPKTERLRLVADGFGMLTTVNKYGNGALYVKKEDLKEATDNQSVDFPVLRIIENEHLRNGGKIEIRGDKVCLIRADNEIVAMGDTLQDLLTELIFILC